MFPISGIIGDLMLLGFYPNIHINHDWTQLVDLAQHTAENFVHNQVFQDHLLYSQGASQVAGLPGGGWISKSAPSQDFFVIGGLPETQDLEQRLKSVLPMLTWTPATIGYTSGHVPEHQDHPKNGRTSLVYPIKDNPSLGAVTDPESGQEFYYLHQKDRPIMINIQTPHRVYVHAPRIWFTLHCHESIDEVKQIFDHLGPVSI